MVLLTVDFTVLMAKIYSGLFVVKTNFNRNHLARYHRFSVVFYLQGLFKLFLIDLALISGESVVVSVPIYMLTMIYFLSAVFFLPVLHIMVKIVDRSYARIIEKERQDTMRK
jgi:hypothetical protein